MKGTLHYSESDKRYHIISADDDTALHCGNCITVTVDGKELNGRIEMNGSANHGAEWYIVLDGTDLSNIEGLAAEIKE